MKKGNNSKSDHNVVTTLKLRVAGCKIKDVGKKKALLDNTVMKKLGVSNGDVVEIVGKKVTAVIVSPLDDKNQKNNYIHIDGQTRKNAGVSLNDYVLIKKTNPNFAEKVILLCNTTQKLSDDFISFLNTRFEGYPFTKGDKFVLNFLGKTFEFIIYCSFPKQVVKINKNTKIVIKPGFSRFQKENPQVSYEQIGGLKNQITRLREIVELPLRHPEVFSKIGIEPHKGILLFGPPGCGKTLIAKALATEGSINIIFVRGPEVLSKWVGESEKAIREIFRKARSSSPCVVVFDEMDSLGRPRTTEDISGNERVLSQILSEMDDSSNFGVIVIGITSRPDLLDTSLLRPGRFDLILFVGPPDEKSRRDILSKVTLTMPLSSDIDFNNISIMTKGYSGADLVSLCRFAAINAIQNKSKTVCNSDFEYALTIVNPSITHEVHNWYMSVEKKLTSAVPKFNDKIFYG